MSSGRSPKELTEDEALRELGRAAIRCFGLKRTRPYAPAPQAPAPPQLTERLPVDDLTQQRAKSVLAAASAAPASPWLSRKAAARVLGVDPRTFDARFRPHLKDHGNGGQPRFRISDVHALLSRRSKERATAPRAPQASAPSEARSIRRVRRRRRMRSVTTRVAAARVRAERELTRALRDHAAAMRECLRHAGTVSSVTTPVAANHHSPPRVMLSERGAEILDELRKDK
jgi:hypothetical protein